MILRAFFERAAELEDPLSALFVFLFDGHWGLAFSLWYVDHCMWLELCHLFHLGFYANICETYCTAQETWYAYAFLGVLIPEAVKKFLAFCKRWCDIKLDNPRALGENY